MGWLRKERTLERGTQQWQVLYDCLRSLAINLWRYYETIEEEEWDLDQIHLQISAIEDNLQMAKETWREGQTILERLSQSMAAMFQVREDEHHIITHPFEFDFTNIEKTQRRYARRRKEKDKFMRKFDSTVKEMEYCCNELKKRTSIDITKWIEQGVE